MRVAHQSPNEEFVLTRRCKAGAGAGAGDGESWRLGSAGDKENVMNGVT